MYSSKPIYIQLLFGGVAWFPFQYMIFVYIEYGSLEFINGYPRLNFFEAAIIQVYEDSQLEIEVGQCNWGDFLGKTMVEVGQYVVEIELDFIKISFTGIRSKFELTECDKSLFR
jgi:hypothetical protein